MPWQVTQRVSPFLLRPQILAKKYVGPEVDVWSMGVVLFTMLAGRFPFGNVSHIIDGQYTLPETISPGASMSFDLFSYTGR